MTRDVVIVATACLMSSCPISMAQTEPDESQQRDQGSLVAHQHASFVSERWCIRTFLSAPIASSLFEPAPSVFIYSPTLYYVNQDFRFVDQSAWSNRLAELESDKLFAFWRGESLGLFFGVTDNGYVGLSLTETEDDSSQ